MHRYICRSASALCCLLVCLSLLSCARQQVVSSDAPQSLPVQTDGDTATTASDVTKAPSVSVSQSTGGDSMQRTTTTRAAGTTPAGSGQPTQAGSTTMAVVTPSVTGSSQRPFATTQKGTAPTKTGKKPAGTSVAVSTTTRPVTTTTTTQRVTVIRVDDHGLKGDGKTDCYAAFDRLLSSTVDKKEKLIFEFSKNKTYLFDSVDQHGMAITLANRENITLRGENTTLLLGKGFGYLDIQFCRNVRVEGFNLNLSRPIYTMAKVLDIRAESRTVEVQTERDLGISGTWTRTDPAPNFGFPDLLDQGRYHLFFDRIETVDAKRHRYRIQFLDVDGCTEKIQRMKSTGCEFIMPMPDVAHHNGSSVVVTFTENLTMEDVNLWASSHFAFHMRYNTGDFILRRTNIVPKPGSEGKIVSWRDGFHIKENRAKFLWEDCRIGGCGDDVFNLSCSTLTVDTVYSDTEFSMGCREFGGLYPAKLYGGDKITLYNVETGALIGETTILEVVRQSGPENRVITRDPIPYNTPGVQVAVNSLANPGARIMDCRVEGTFRFRGEVTCEDTDFRITYSWIENEHPVEGPIPKNILFRNCSLKGLTNTATFMSLGATAAVSRPQYRCQNIRFIDCDVNPARIYMRPGNDVQFIRKGQVYYRCPP